KASTATGSAPHARGAFWTQENRAGRLWLHRTRPSILRRARPLSTPGFDVENALVCPVTVTTPGPCVEDALVRAKRSCRERPNQARTDASPYGESGASQEPRSLIFVSAHLLGAPHPQPFDSRRIHGRSPLRRHVEEGARRDAGL